jgi:hypothetical protein
MSACVPIKIDQLGGLRHGPERPFGDCFLFSYKCYDRAVMVRIHFQIHEAESWHRANRAGYLVDYGPVSALAEIGNAFDDRFHDDV